MMRRFSVRSAALVAVLGVAVSGCGQIRMLQAKMAFRDANSRYQAQDFRVAKEKYEEAVELDPNLTAAYFFLGNSADNLFRPARRGEPENDQLLTVAIENYERAAEQAEDPAIRRLAMEYLVAAYNNPDKVNDPSLAEPLLLRMIEMEPQNASSYFALAKVYEDYGIYDQAEQALLKARAQVPNSPEVYMQLAGYYNRQGEFDKTIEALQARAEREPQNPEAYYTIATYYWDKAYRDFRLADAEKRQFVQSGVDMVDKALSLKDDYSEAMVYKNLLLRLQANLETDRGRQQALLRQADQLRDRAEQLRQQQQAAPPSGD
ncbi:MAG: tetratricopeptide repeat protein [Acidimicrobiia bacterium]|nr:tetratricopeptide repeat protein [Acidimicrobiia bacterium]